MHVEEERSGTCSEMKCMTTVCAELLWIIYPKAKWWVLIRVHVSRDLSMLFGNTLQLFLSPPSPPIPLFCDCDSLQYYT